MTFNKFKSKVIKFLEESNVNLGRKKSKTREAFLDSVEKMFDKFEEQPVKKQESPKKKNPMEGSVLKITPKDPRKALDVGKGVHAMTPTESARADEQLGRSPYVVKED